MAMVSTYLNFERESEEAFNFYAQVFGTEIMNIMRYGDIEQEGLPEEDKNLVMNAAMTILGGHMLMASDISKAMGHELIVGNNIQITLHPDTRAEADRLHAALMEGGTLGQEMQEMFWGDYFGDVIDKFGIRWLVNCSSKE